MAMQTFVNLPVRDLAKTTEFFTKLGFSFDPQFTDETATRMIRVIVGLSAESRGQVDELADKALAAGAEALGEPEDQGFIYMRGFRDLDGHQWSFIHMDMSAIPEQ